MHNHAKLRPASVEPRGWQKSAIRNFLDGVEPVYMQEACPAAGKTVFSGLCARGMVESGQIDFIVVIVPLKPLKASFVNSWWSDCGLALTDTLREGYGPPVDFNGAVITYSQLPNMVSTFRVWAVRGWRILFVFDEIHHASDKNIWGLRTEECGEFATKILAMSGTPFRSDRQKIKFLRYNENGVCIPDGEPYTYKHGVGDTVCRPVVYITETGTVEYSETVGDETTIYRQSISNPTPEQKANVKRLIFDPKQEWMRTMLKRADEKLSEYRETYPNAGGLIVCRPGWIDDSDISDADERHVKDVAKAMSAICGEDVPVVSHDDKDATAIIDRFRKGNARWLASVRMVSEGVDVKRLMVGVMATEPSTELLFRQLSGRFMRVMSAKGSELASLEDATIFIAKLPLLEEWAKRISDEAQAGVKEKRERPEILDGGEGPGEVDRAKVTVAAIDTTYENGGAIAIEGATFSNTELDEAERIKQTVPGASNLPLSAILAIHRHIKQGGTQEKAENDEVVEEIPLHTRKRQGRIKLSELSRRYTLTRARLSGREPDFKQTSILINRMVGVRNINDLVDNYPIEYLERAIEIMQTELRKLDAKDFAKDFSDVA